MCRMVGYVGVPLRPRALLTDAPHSLSAQSWKPREMQTGTVNADGWGAALWLDDGKAEPVVYRWAAPIWADPHLGWLGERMPARALLAAVRSATPGIGYEWTSLQPFSSGANAFVHNGFIEGFRGPIQRDLRESLGERAYAAVQGGSDSELLFGLVLDGLDRGLAPALRSACARVGEACRKRGVRAFATCLVSDGRELVGCRWASEGTPATLYVARVDGGVCLASEPLGNAPFEPVPDGGLVVVRDGDVHTEAL